MLLIGNVLTRIGQEEKEDAVLKSSNPGKRWATSNIIYARGFVTRLTYRNNNALLGISVQPNRLCSLTEDKGEPKRKEIYESTIKYNSVSAFTLVAINYGAMATSGGKSTYTHTLLNKLDSVKGKKDRESLRTQQQRVSTNNLGLIWSTIHASLLTKSKF